MGLAVYVDGTAMPEAEARAFWQRFSDWMEENKGDLRGFAEKEGFVSVHPCVENGRPILHASRTNAQRPYAPVGGGGGSGGRHEAIAGGSVGRPKSRQKGRKRDH